MRRAYLSVRRRLMMLFGAFLLAFAYYHINFQNHLSEGGFVGLALLAKYAFNLSPAAMTLALDIPLFLLAAHMKGRRFLANTILASIGFSVFYYLFERFSPLVLPLHNSMVLAALLSGLLTGAGMGIVLRYGGATGGDDILCLLLSKSTGLSIGTVFLLLDCIVLSLSLLYLRVDEVLYTILAVSIASGIITWTVGAKTQSEKPAHSRPVQQPITLSRH